MAGSEIMLIALFSVFFCLFVWWIVHDQKHAGNLSAPLLPGDAHAGYYKCRLCGFENFKRLLFCTLCGTSLRLTAPLDIPETGVERASQRQRRARFVADVRVLLIWVVDVNGGLTLALSRRDWTRKLDIEGRLFWYQAANWESKRRHQGYTLHFVWNNAQEGATHAQSEVYGEPEAEQHASSACDDTKTQPLVVIEVFPPDAPLLADAARSNTTETPTLPVALETEANAGDAAEPDSTVTQLPETQSVALIEKSAVIRDLIARTSHLTLVLVDFETSDPSLLPLEPDDNAQETESPSIDWRTLVEMAQKDFPTKYSHFVDTTASLLVHVTKQYIKLTIPPDNLLPDSLIALSTIPRSYIHSVMRIEFAGDRGVDAGALQREWHVLLNRELANPLNGIFKCVNAAEQTFYLNPNSAHDIGEVDHLLYYFAAGRLVGRSLLEGQALSFHLALPLLKSILGVPLSFNDLEHFDPEAYKSLVWIMRNDGAGDLGLTFSITEQRGDQIVEVDLIENGRNIDVDDDNKELYLERKFRYLLFESVSSQLFAFLKGIYEIIPQELLVMFDPEEFDYVLCSSDDIDVDEWQRSTVTSTNLQRHGNTLKWFWELVREMPNEYRRRLLLFATGSSRVPLGGFSALTSVDGRLCPFTLAGVKLTESTGYIVSHACFNRLDIPLYKSRASLETMLCAILETEQHGFTTD